MSDSNIFIGNSPLNVRRGKVTGEYTLISEEEYYKISNFNLMPPFFMTVVSASNHWLFISSNGGLSAGRKNADMALFPYATDDKITDSAEITGSKTIFKVKQNGKTYLWEPFSEQYMGVYPIIRNIYKNRIGNKILFEETNEALALTFRYLWTFSEKYGFVKKSTLLNNSGDEVETEILDGIQNILPYGIDSELQNSKSTLVDAYKKNELITESGIGVYSLSAMIVDKAEPSEALLATTAWSIGLDVNKHLLSSSQLIKFRNGQTIEGEEDIRAERGAYFINTETKLSPKSATEWYIISDVSQPLAKIVSLKEQISNTVSLRENLEADISAGTEELRILVGMADGIQLSNDRMSTGRHYSNVLFNIMRGGIFEDQFQVYNNDLRDFIQIRNKKVADQHTALLESIPSELSYQDLLLLAADANDLDLERICYEYLPISFSRRHGDPSRPWNTFSIETKDPFGNKIKGYEGNWRDIFQNWEALALSFPEYVEAMITKFVNASTIDGYNPYRITKDGIDWEVVEPNDPWSFIGYWGDHQIIYLAKLLEISANHHPGRLHELMTKPINVYANVPYRIKNYEDILKDPSDTIFFDEELAAVIEQRVNLIGSDGELVWNKDEQVIRANLTEKILVAILAKLYNFIPEAGIWLNTQRPEWNDANNALVGKGASMVTLYYLHRFLKFCVQLFGQLKVSSISVNAPVADLFNSLDKIFSDNIKKLEAPLTDEARKNMMDELGLAGEEYRSSAYRGFAGDMQSLAASDIAKMLELALLFMQHSITHNKRKDGLYHSYNLIEVDNTKVGISNMYEMLEGQVAVLSAKSLSAKESLEVLDALKSSNMFRADQYSYMLYPNRELPLFVEKNHIPAEFANNSILLKKLIEDNNHALVEQDLNGNYHFNGLFHNVKDLILALEMLAETEYEDLIEQERDSLLAAYEQVFEHKSFTGRSGTFYGYEGLGSIYWHMVSKLLLATQENINLARTNQTDAGIIGRLIEHYYEIRAGIGINKTPDLYGAFPTDAYSHTPGNMGAQQPGMTGQVKEDIINRWAELGVTVDDGKLSFKPFFLKENEFLHQEETFSYTDIQGKKRTETIPEGGLAFTYCQVPIIYINGQDEMIKIIVNGNSEEISGNTLSSSMSAEIFCRTGLVERIYCYLNTNKN